MYTNTLASASVAGFKVSFSVTVGLDTFTYRGTDAVGLCRPDSELLEGGDCVPPLSLPSLPHHSTPYRAGAWTFMVTWLRSAPNSLATDLGQCLRGPLGTLGRPRRSDRVTGESPVVRHTGGEPRWEQRRPQCSGSLLQGHSGLVAALVMGHGIPSGPRAWNQRWDLTCAGLKSRRPRAGTPPHTSRKPSVVLQAFVLLFLDHRVTETDPRGRPARETVHSNGFKTISSHPSPLLSTGE